MAAEGFVHVVWDDVELVIFITEDVVVTGACPVAVAVAEYDVVGDEPECFVDVEDGGEFLFE